MSQLLPPPRYHHKPIHSLAAVSRVLGYSVETLKHVAGTSSSRYRLAKPILKADGSFRRPFDALYPLKDIQIRIKQRILTAVTFPAYLTGSLKGQDQVRNAKLHQGASITVCEDIKSFFPSTTSKVIFDIWRGFFGFSEDVSNLLTLLTTKDDLLPQGAVTSSHLANLVFWRREHALYLRLASQGVRYSRYVDDITLSSRLPVTHDDLARHISLVYGMIRSTGHRAHRGKQEIQRAHRGMRATKLLVNRRAALGTAERQATRAAVYALERSFAVTGGVLCPALIKELNSLSGRVSRLARLHANEGQALRARLMKLRNEVGKSHRVRNDFSQDEVIGVEPVHHETGEVMQ